VQRDEQLAAWTDDALRPCLATAPLPTDEGFLGSPLARIDDAEGERLDASLPPVIDAHVHLFPWRMFEALWRWFDRYGWPVRYRLDAEAIVQFLLSRGVRRIVALHYPHKDGMAEALNRFMSELCARHPEVQGVATVHPGEPDARGIVERAFAAGLRGVKLHCHVQSFSPDDPSLHEIYECCVEHDAPLVMHAGREPRSPGYRRDPHELCSADRVAAVLRDYPGLRLCVPHLGADEFGAYAELLERHDNLWLDTTMAMAGFFPVPDPVHLLSRRPDRILYGTDFPNIPFAWDREIKRIAAQNLDDDALAAVLSGNACELFGLAPP
jgi:hypothetical protein